MVLFKDGKEKKISSLEVFSVPLLLILPLLRSSQDIPSDLGRQLICWGLDSSEDSFSFPLSKQEEPCFTSKQMLSAMVCPFMDSPSVILPLLVNAAFEENVNGRPSDSLITCTLWEISSCTQGSVSKNKFSDY